MRRRSMIPAFILALMLYSPNAHAAAITINSQVVEPNALFGLEIRVSDVTDLYAFALDLSFDPTVLQLISVLEGGVFLRNGPTLACGLEANAPYVCPFVEIPDGPSMVSVGNTFLGAPTGVNVGDVSQVLTLLMFQAIGSGNAGVGLSLVSLSDSFFQPIDLDDAPTVGDITVSASVPEPSSLVLLGVGLLATARRLRRRNPAGNQTT